MFACMAWPERQCERNRLNPPTIEDRRKQLGDCFYLIQFGQMGLTQLFRCINDYKGLFDREELEEIITIMSSDGPVSLKRFKSKTMISQIRKEIGPLLEWERFQPNTRSQYHNNYNKFVVNQLEVTSFRSKEKLLLCAISCT